MKVGDTYEVTTTVTEEMTAEAIGSGGLTVLGTPYMLALMESAAYQLLQKSLGAGKSSVGVKLHVAHISPTPVGMEVRAVAETTAVTENGRMVDFKVTAYDGAGLIGEGTHRRAVVDVERFLAKCDGKLGKSK